MARLFARCTLTHILRLDVGLRWAAPLLSGALLGVGCAPSPPTTPDAAVNRYAQALKAEHWEEAYALLSDESRAELSLQQFEQLMVKNRQALTQFLARVETRNTQAHVTASLRTSAGDELTLVYQEGAWRIDESALDLYSQREPRVALASFVHAYDHRRFDVLLQFVPRSHAEGLSEQTLKSAWEGGMKSEMEQVVEALRVSYKTAKLEILGEHATMSYGNGATVELILEDGAWKIENFQ